MIVAFFVVLDDSLLNTFRRNTQCQMNRTIFAFGGSKDTKFYRIQGTAGITACHISQKFQGIVINYGAIISHAFIAVIYGSEDQRADIFITERFQFKNDGAGKESSIYFEIRIFSSCTDQNDRTVLHKWKQVILLAFVETVNLINEKNRFFAIHAKTVLCLFYDFFHVFLTGDCRIDLGKTCTGSICDYLGEGSLSGSGRSIENNRSQLVSFDRTVQ